MNRRRQRIAFETEDRIAESKRVRKNEDGGKLAVSIKRLAVPIINPKEKVEEQETKERSCRFLEEFEMLSTIGEGTYGVVYKAKDKKSGEIIAVKKVKEQSAALPEIEILTNLDHPSIVGLKHVVRGSRGRIYLLMEYVENDVRSLLETMKQAFSESEVKCLMQQLLQGVEYLHANKVLHRDLKSSNLLLNNCGELKICDFGLACRLESSHDSMLHTETVVTLWYRAPELLLNAKEYSTPIDMWSVGCIMAELLSKQPLFDGRTEADQLRKIFKILGTPNDRTWPGFSKLPGVKAKGGGGGGVLKVRNNCGGILRQRFPAMSFTGGPVLSNAGFHLLSKLLTYNPQNRITAKEALNHPWFHQLPLPKSKHFMPTFPPSYATTSSTRLLLDLQLKHSASTGLNCAEAVNFAPADWLPHGGFGAELYRLYHRVPVLSHEELLCVVAKSEFESSVSAYLKEELLRICNNKETWRERLWKNGIIRSSPMTPRVKPDYVA